MDKIETMDCQGKSGDTYTFNMWSINASFIETDIRNNPDYSGVAINKKSHNF